MPNEVGSGVSIDLLRRHTHGLHVWRCRLESGYLTSGCPLWRGNLHEIIVL